MSGDKCTRCGLGQRPDDTFGCDYVVFRWQAFAESGFGYSYSETKVAEGSGNEITDRGLCYSYAREVTAERRATLPPQAPRATLTVRPAATQAERDRDLLSALAGALLVERAVAAEYAATDGRPWAERIAVKARLDAAREAVQAMEGGR